MNTEPPIHPMEDQDFDTLEAILDDLRTRGEDVPQWEFCEGAIAALQCTRRPVPLDEYLPLLLGTGDNPPGVPSAQEGDTWFADLAQFQQFMTLWTRRWNEVATALSANIATLDDPRAYHPEVMDVRGAVATLPEATRAELANQYLPAYGQVWALGFLFVVENWAEEWATPRDPETADWLNDALDILVALTEDDTAPPTISLYSEDGPPSVSEDRMNNLGSAIWAVYDLHQIWQSLGPRLDPMRKTAKPGRNDPCPCGSGKKYKKCHGA